MLIFGCILGMVAVSCDKPSADVNPNPAPGSEDTEEHVITGTISSIHNLNSVVGYVNSHKKDWKTSSLEADNRTLVSLEYPKLSAVNALYPRIKKLANGTYMLIYQQGPSAHDVYYALSSNLVSWVNKDTQLFEKTNMKQYDSDVEDRVLFSSADAVVLSNGDILAFASFRLNAGYKLNQLNNGIMMRRSSDNGQSWTDPEVIYRGTTWEPFPLQLESGEIHVYFTSSDPNKGDSGTALLRSNDNGESWENVGKIIRQLSGTATDGSGDNIYTDQMPSAVELNESGKIAVALESRFSSKYNISFAYSDNNWADAALTGDETGPSERKNSVYTNEAAPYLKQFRSGETVLTTNASNVFNFRIGNAKANDFGSANGLKELGTGYWGSTEIIDDHTIVAVFPNTYTEDGTSKASIQIIKLVLNHRINATNATMALEPNTDNWAGVDDAFFLGSVSQAQASFRFAYDDSNVYCLVERLDENLTSSDGVTLMFQSGDGTGSPLSISITADASSSTLLCDNSQVGFAYGIDGTFDNVEDDNGYVLVLSIPKSLLSIVSDKFLFNAEMSDEGGTDTFTGLTANNYSKWLPVLLGEPAEPDPDPQPGVGESTGDGPSWEEGSEEVNPW